MLLLFMYCCISLHISLIGCSCRLANTLYRDNVISDINFVIVTMQAHEMYFFGRVMIIVMTCSLAVYCLGSSSIQ